MSSLGSFSADTDLRLKVLLIDDVRTWTEATLGKLAELFSVETASDPLAVWKLLNDPANAHYHLHKDIGSYTFKGQPYDVIAADFDLRDGAFNIGARIALLDAPPDLDDCMAACGATAAGYIAAVLLALAFPRHPCSVVPFSAKREVAIAETALLRLLAPSVIHVGIDREPPKGSDIYEILANAVTGYREALLKGHISGRLRVDAESAREVLDQVDNHNNTRLRNVVLRLQVDGWIRSLSCQALFLDCLLTRDDNGQFVFDALDANGVSAVRAFIQVVLVEGDRFRISREAALAGWNRFKSKKAVLRRKIQEVYQKHGHPQPAIGAARDVPWERFCSEAAEVFDQWGGPDDGLVDKDTLQDHMEDHFFLDLPTEMPREVALAAAMLVIRYWIVDKVQEVTEGDLHWLFDPMPWTEHWYFKRKTLANSKVSRACVRKTKSRDAPDSHGLHLMSLRTCEWHQLRSFFTVDELKVLREYATSIDPDSSGWPSFLQE